MTRHLKCSGIAHPLPKKRGGDIHSPNPLLCTYTGVMVFINQEQKVQTLPLQCERLVVFLRKTAKGEGGGGGECNTPIHCVCLDRGATASLGFFRGGGGGTLKSACALYLMHT